MSMNHMHVMNHMVMSMNHPMVMSIESPYGDVMNHPMVMSMNHPMVMSIIILW